MKKFYENFEQYFVASLLAGMTLLAVVNVFVRYVLKGNILWAMEAKIFMFAWLIFFGASWGIRIGAHIGMESFVNLFSSKIKRFFALFAVLLCLAYAIIILIGSYNYVEKIYSVGILSQDIKWLPQWVPRLIMPIGYGLIIFRLVEILIRIILGKQDNLNLLDEAKDAIKSFKFDNNNPKQ
jgi:C4-dicarboxylate transporter DctQ subunit